MALDTDNLAGQNIGNFQQHTYVTTDAIATVVAADYFLSAYRMLKPNDVIIAVCSTGGTRTVDVLVVATSSAAGVTTINGT